MYFRGVPLNAELERIRAGQDNPIEEVLGLARGQEPEARPILDEERELDDEDRRNLRDLRNSPGWIIFEMLQRQAIRTHETTALAISRIAPLANRDKIAEEWALVEMYKKGCSDVRALVAAEIGILEQGEKDAGQPARILRTGRQRSRKRAPTKIRPKKRS
jgi:hypothetical protein